MAAARQLNCFCLRTVTDFLTKILFAEENSVIIEYAFHDLSLTNKNIRDFAHAKMNILPSIEF